MVVKVFGVVWDCPLRVTRKQRCSSKSSIRRILISECPAAEPSQNWKRTLKQALCLFQLVFVRPCFSNGINIIDCF